MISMRNRTLLSIFHVSAYAAVIIIMGQRAIADPAQLAVLYVALNLFGLMGEALNGISGSIATVFADMQILAYINRLMNKTPEKTTGLSIPKDKLIIEFKDVSYKYPGAKNYALKNLNLTLREGEHIAVVGKNGAGKTTFLKLLSGLDKPTSGKILLNGKPLGNYIPAKWRKTFHLMTQDASLYQDFVKDNLYYGTDNKQSTDISYENAQFIAGSNVIIKSLPRKRKNIHRQLGGTARHNSP